MGKNPSQLYYLKIKLKIHEAQENTNRFKIKRTTLTHIYSKSLTVRNKVNSNNRKMVSKQWNDISKLLSSNSRPTKHEIK